MNRFQFKSIRIRLTFWFFIIAILPLTIAVVVTYVQRVSVIEARTFDKLKAIRDLKVQQLEKWFEERNGDINTLSIAFEIRALEGVFKQLKSSSEQEIIRQNAQGLLNGILFHYNAYTEIFIIDAKTGNIKISTNPASVGLSKASDPYFTVPLATGESFIKDIYSSRTTNSPAMTFSIPVFSVSRETEIIGILVARIDLENSLYSLLLNRTGLGETGETLIVNSDVIALNELRWFDNAPLKLKIPANAALSAAQGETGISETTDYRGENVLAAYTYIKEPGWGFVCKQDIRELNAPIRDLVRNFVILITMSIVLIFLTATGVAKSTSRPVINMTKVSKNIQEGDFSIRNELRETDELGFLAETFNKMADTIESRINIQKGVSGISNTVIGKAGLKEYGSELLKYLMELTGSNLSAFYILEEKNNTFTHLTSIGAGQALLEPFSAVNPEGEFGNVVSTKKIFHLKEIPVDTIFKFKTVAGVAIPREILAIPIMVENRVLAIISLAKLDTFSPESLDIINQSWIAINTSYANLFASEQIKNLADELQQKNIELQGQAAELQSQAEELQQSSEELQEQNLELDMQKTQVEEANRLKSEFLSNMSHELRTPLNSIMALSSVLLMRTKNKLTDDEFNYIEVVERNGKQLLKLINDILDLAKIEAGKMDIQPKFVLLDSMLNVVKENLQPIADEKKITLKLTIQKKLPNIETDEIRLHQAFSNIIGNSVKFTEKGGVDIFVRFDAEKVYIEVKDTGIGISEETIPHIFEEFRQVDGSSSRKYEGTGLGLTIASKMIKTLGGDISVKSEIGTGSTFMISLPIKWPEKLVLAEPVSFKQDVPIAGENILQKNLDGSKTRILLVEDNEIAILQVKEVLESEGYFVDVASGGQEALDYLKHTIPDGIILDLMMPEIDGFQVLENIRSKGASRMVPVLILTAKDLSKQDLAKLSVNNIQQLITKGDVDKKEMLFKVKLMLRNVPVDEGKIKEEQKNKIKEEPENKIKEELINQKAGETGKSKLAGLPTILVVEDNPDNILSIVAILKDSYNILTAEDGEKGLLLAEQELPDLVLLDIMLPKMDGFEVVKKIRAGESTAKIPVIAITSKAMEGDRQKILDSGCDDYISKPIDVAETMNKIKKCLR